MKMELSRCKHLVVRSSPENSPISLLLILQSAYGYERLLTTTSLSMLLIFLLCSIYNRKKILQHFMLQAAKEANIQVGAGLSASTAVHHTPKMLVALISVAATGALLAGYFAGNAIYAR